MIFVRSALRSCRVQRLLGIGDFASSKVFLILIMTFTIQELKSTNAYTSPEVSGNHLEEPKQNDNHIWTVIDPNENYPCILLQGSLEFRIPNLEGSGFKTLKVPEEAVAKGTCTTMWKDYQDIKLTWNSPTSNDSFTETISLYLGFATSWESEFTDLSIPPHQYALNAITIVYNTTALNELAKANLISYSVSDFIAFLTSRDRSYSCLSENVLVIGDLEMITSNLRLQAFSIRDGSGQQFFESIECGDDVNHEILSGTFEFIKWFFVASAIVIVSVILLYLLLRYIQNRLNNWNISYKVLWRSWS